MEEPSLTSSEGGYYPVKKGETFNGRYHVVQNLGYGFFSTVWLCQDAGKKRCVAVKVPKGGENFAEAALDEVMLLRYVNSKRRKDRGSDCIIHLLDDFKMIGENGFHILWLSREILSHPDHVCPKGAFSKGNRTCNLTSDFSTEGASWMRSETSSRKNKSTCLLGCPLVDSPGTMGPPGQPCIF